MMEKIGNKHSILVMIAAAGLLSFAVNLIESSVVRAALSDLFPARQFSIVAEPIPVTTRTCLITEKIDEKDENFDKHPVSVSATSTVWTEKRVNGSKPHREPDRDIILKLLNSETCEISFLTVRQTGTKIIAPAGWDIKMLERANGITFNFWNTAYQVVQPANHMVLKNKFPLYEDKTITVKVKNKAGKLVNQKQKQHVLKGHIVYAPYSPDLDKPELIAGGKNYIASIAGQAIKDLRDRNVHSRVQSGLVADVKQLPQDHFERLPLLEQTDLFEFNMSPKESVERVYVITATNKENAYNATCSSASACGLVQFTRPTWNALRKYYPEAGLISFEEGARNHVQSMTAAVLLYDYNLADLVRKYGRDILNDPKLEEYLAASYNGKPARVTKSITAAVRANISDWMESLTAKAGGLANETRGYMVKLRYLQQNS